jgi:hypothetical protein
MLSPITPHPGSVCPIVSTTSLLSLGTTSLFCALYRCDGAHGEGYIPLVLPSIANEASPASSSFGPGRLLEDSTTDTVVTLLLASRDDREPQLGGDGIFLPPGFPHNATGVMYGGKCVSRQLLTPLMKLFSSHRDWNNHRARRATVDDFNSLRLGLKLDIPTSQASGESCANFVTSDSLITAMLSEVILAMDRIVHQCPRDDPDFNLGGYERLFKTISLACCGAYNFYDAITDRLMDDMRELAPGPKREASYWLALNQFLPTLTSIFLSPVNLPSRWLLAVMQHGALVQSPSDVGGIPILQKSTEAPLVRHCPVTTTLYQPNPAWKDNVSLDKVESLMQMAASVDSSSDDDANDKEAEHDDTRYDPALSESVRVLCQRSVFLPDVIQNFGEPGIDVQRYVYGVHSTPIFLPAMVHPIFSVLISSSTSPSPSRLPSHPLQ